MSQMQKTDQTVQSLLEQFYQQSQQLMTNINNKKHSTLLLKRNTAQKQQENELLQEQNQYLQTMLNQFQNVLTKLQIQNQQIISKDKDFWSKNQQLATKYHQKLLSEEDIIKNTIINLPNSSLDTLQQFYSEITQQKLVKTIQSGEEKKNILQNLQNTKDRFQKVQQKCRGIKSRTKNN